MIHPLSRSVAVAVGLAVVTTACRPGDGEEAAETAAAEAGGLQRRT